MESIQIQETMLSIWVASLLKKVYTGKTLEEGWCAEKQTGSNIFSFLKTYHVYPVILILSDNQIAAVKIAFITKIIFKYIEHITTKNVKFR